MLIDGTEIYKKFLPFIDRIYVTLVDGEFVGDSYFPEYHNQDWNCFYEEVGMVSHIKLILEKNETFFR